VKAIYYRIKQPQSVPMYDHIKDSYHVLIGEEMVEVPAVLFNKLFESIDLEQQEREESALKMSGIDPASLRVLLEFLSNPNSPEAKEIYNDMKEQIKTVKRIGLSRDLIHYAMKDLLIRGGLADSIEDFKRITNKIYDELESEGL
jgi:hypothetical protein